MARGLVVKVGGDTSGFDKAMSRAQSVASVASSDIARRFVSSASAINQAYARLGMLRNLALGFVAFKVSAAVIEGAWNQAKESLQEFIDVLDKANSANVGVEFLQKFTSAAKDARIEASTFEQALTNAYEATKPRLDDNPLRQRLSDIFETGYVGNFQSQGLRMFDNADNTEARIRGVLVAMKELEDLGRNLAAIDIAERMFGKQFAENIRTGKVQIETLLNKLDATEAKNLISQQDAENAKRLSERLDDAKTKLDEALAVSISLAAAGRVFYQIWVDIVERIAEAATGVSNLLGKLGQVPAALAKATTVQGGGLLQPLDENSMRFGQATGNPVEDRRMRQGYYTPEDYSVPPPPGANVPLPPTRPFGLKYDTPKPERSGGGSPSETVSQIERLTIQMEKQAQLAETELKTLGLSNIEKAKALALVEAEAAAKRDVAAGFRETVDLTEQEKSRILAAASATAEWKERVRQVQDAMESVKDITGDALKGFISDLRQGKSAADALKGALDRILDRVTSKLIDNALSGLLGGGSSGGSLTSLFSGLFGGARAGGGSVAGGTAYLVGERGPELFVPGRSGTIVPNGIGGGGGGGAVVNVTVQNNAGAEIGVKQSRGPNGIDIQLVVEQAVLKSMNGGAIGRQMQSYGFNRMNAR